MRSSQLGSQNIRRREQEKETATERRRRQTERVQNKERESEGARKKKKERQTGGGEESDNKWNDDAHCEGLPRVHSATWNYSTRKRLGRLLSEASGLADFSVRKNAMSNRVWRDCAVTDASIIYEGSNSYHYQA